jgi:hypothetical protein
VQDFFRLYPAMRKWSKHMVYVRGEVEDSFLGTTFLVVAKQAPTGFSGISAPPGFEQIGGLKSSGASSEWIQSTAMSASTAFEGPEGNAVNDAGKNKKRKSKTLCGVHFGGYAPINQAYGGSSSLHSSKSRVLASILAQQGSGRASLFQIPSFLLVSIRIRDDLLRRVLTRFQEQVSSVLAPYSINRSWTSLL